METIKLSPLRKGIVGVQFLFVAFGATVLVPLLVGLDPATALFSAGIGTIIYFGNILLFWKTDESEIRTTSLEGVPGWTYQ